MTEDPTVSWKERKGIVVGLLVAVVGIWGYVGYTLVDTLGSAADEEVVASARSPERPPASGSERLGFVYSGAFRDPFAPPFTGEPSVAQADAPAPRPREPKPEPEPPRVRLLGLVDGAATVETAAGTIHFVRRGDEVEGARVTAVGEGGITLRKEGRSFDIPLQ